MGMSIKNHLEITKCIPNQLIEVSTILGPINIKHRIHFNKLSPLTEVTWSQDIDFKGMYMAMRPFMVSKVKNQLKQDLEHLKDVLDNSSALITMITQPNAKFWL